MKEDFIIINTKTIEDLTEQEKIILSIKGAIIEMQKNKELENLYGAFIYSSIIQLENEYGIKKEDIYKYRFNFVKEVS